jgi:hypothetical protein
MSTWARYEECKHTATIESAEACGCTAEDLPCAWKYEHLIPHGPALGGGGTPLATRTSDDGGLAYGEWSKARLVLLLEILDPPPRQELARRLSTEHRLRDSL